MSYAEFGPLAQHLRYVERSSRKLARHTFYGMARWQAKLEYAAGVPGPDRRHRRRAVRHGRVHLARRAHAHHGPRARRFGRAAGTAFCEQSEHRCEALFKELWANSDKTDRKLTKRVLAGDFEWLEAGIIDTSEGTGEWIAGWSDESLPDQRRLYAKPPPRQGVFDPSASFSAHVEHQAFALAPETQIIMVSPASFSLSESSESR